MINKASTITFITRYVFFAGTEVTWVVYQEKSEDGGGGQPRSTERLMQQEKGFALKRSTLPSQNFGSFYQLFHPIRSYRRLRFCDWLSVILLTWIMSLTHEYILPDFYLWPATIEWNLVSYSWLNFELMPKILMVTIFFNNILFCYDV